jgi:NOL1/NOP2/sun family putative RNA methylase
MPVYGTGMDGNKMSNLPEAFVKRMQSQLGNELPAFLHAMDETPIRGIRINPLKSTSATACFTCSDPVLWEKNSWYLPEGSEAGSSAIHIAGAFYIQEPAAMIPAVVLDAKPGEIILDLCAAPGGKSTQIGCAMKGEGLLIANEPVTKRAKTLSGNIERMGIPNAIVTCAWPEQLAERWPEAFDGVLVDAPCSGEGMFRRDPKTRDEWTHEKAAGCAERQRIILASAAKLVCPGGRLVYSTCTYNPDENEENVNWFIKTQPEFSIESFSLPGIDAHEGLFNCYPHRIKGEGQFIALFRRKGERKAVIPSVCSLPVATKEIRKAFMSAFPMLPEPTHLFGNTLIHMPEFPDIQGIRILRVGLHLGEIRGKNIFPDYAAALCMRQPEIISLDLGMAEIGKYLAGEEIPGNTEGWTLIRYQGLSVGWGKGSGGKIKNHFPKGLRGNWYLP